MLSEMQVRQNLATSKFGRTIFEIHEQIDSTNTRTKILGTEGAPEGSIVLAEYQSAGRGRLGRAWHSPSGLNLYFSILLRPHIPIYQYPLITLAAALSLSEAIEKSTGLQPSIKWPNDLLINGKKLAGILTEMELLDPGSAYAILGIGLNVNLDRKHLPEALVESAGSLLIESGKAWPRERILAAVLNTLEKNYFTLNQGEFEEIRGRYLARCHTIGRMVTVTVGREPISGKAVDVDESGRLVIEKESDGERTAVNSGEVTLTGSSYMRRR